MISEAVGLRNRSSGEIGQRSDERYAALKNSLPSHGIVGYLAPTDRNPVKATEDYYLAEYALAPLVVDRSIQHEIVIGDFSSSDSLTALPPYLHVIRDLGNGVLLLRSDVEERKDER